MPFVNGPSASVASHSLRVNEYLLSAELHLLRLRRHSLCVSVSMLLEYGRYCSYDDQTIRLAVKIKSFARVTESS